MGAYGSIVNKKTMEEALMAHEAFRRLGFPPDDIFVGLEDGQMLVVPVRGDLRFNLEVGAFEGTREEWLAAWDLAVQTWRAMPETECKEMWEASKVKAKGVDLVIAMVVKGFHFSEGLVN